MQAGLTSAQASITSLGATLALTSAGTLLAFDLVNQKSWILFFQKPLRSDISSNVYLDFDTICAPARVNGGWCGVLQGG
jgi:hypothetical protein